MKAKAARRDGGIASWYMKLPIMNVMDGERYCTKPTVVRGTCLIATAKRARGIVVIIPVPASSRVVEAE